MKTIIFFGDSITDSFRDRTAPYHTEEQLGMGYVRHLHAHLHATHPNIKINFINHGISGDTSRDLLNRLEQDVLNVEADTVFMMIGVNDVWQRFEPTRKNEWIYPEDFKENYRTIIEAIQKNKQKLILLSPFYLELDQQDPMRKLLNDYQMIIQHLAQAYHLDYIDIQKAMDAYLEIHDYQDISDDKVHVNHIGNAIIANTIDTYMKKAFDF